MPLAIPTRKSLTQSVRAYFLSEVPEWDTSTERRSFVGGLLKSLGSALHDWYVALGRATLQMFPQTAQGEFLTQGWWSSITGLSPNPATPAQGVVVLTGTAATVIPATSVLSVNGEQYTVDHDASIVAQSIAATSLTSAGGLATFNTASPHLLATGQSAVISGASPSDYNGTFPITAIGDNAFTYPIITSPSSPATGSPLASVTCAHVSATCKSTGPNGNLDSGATLQVAPAISGVDATARVTFDGVLGGQDVETPNAYRQRLLTALGTDFGTFTADEIVIVAKQIPGVTRVFVRTAAVNPLSGFPAEGQVFVAFMRDFDSNPFPAALQVSAMQAHIAATIMPANTPIDDVVVSSPTPHLVNFTFTALSPNTATMRAAILANLTQFFEESPVYGVNVLQDDYRCAIRDTYDTQTRTRLTSFALSAPSGDITITASQIGALGTVTFP